MFGSTPAKMNWNAETTMAALDAGIGEVIRIFNRAHASAWRNGVALSRKQGVVAPVFSASQAFTLALESTVAQLQFIEAGVAPNPKQHTSPAERKFVQMLRKQNEGDFTSFTPADGEYAVVMGGSIADIARKALSI